MIDLYISKTSSVAREIKDERNATNNLKPTSSTTLISAHSLPGTLCQNCERMLVTKYLGIDDATSLETAVL
jgi:hypothetical protein